MIKVGSDFSGVGAFDQALIRLGIDYETVFACDMDKYARQTYIHNYGEPKYYPENVYDREIPTEPLDIFMTSPPCQSFSLAGKRLGEDDERGILFYNSHEFIQKNKPRYFIFENVKGLLSDSDGKTFRAWVAFLGGKSINGNPVLFPHEKSVPYHIYYKVLNAKDYGIPQNRERVFIVGIRDDEDNNFTWPKEMFLEKRLKDVLESEVDEKYYLSDEFLDSVMNHSDKHKEKGNGFKFEPKEENEIGVTITTKPGQRTTDNYIKVRSTTSKGYEVAQIGEDSVVIEERIHGWHENENVVAAHRGDKKRSTVSEHVYHKENGVCTTIQTAHIPKTIIGIGVHPFSKKLEFDGFKDRECPTLLATDYKAPKCVQYSDYRIRKLTPRECFRLMDFPESFTWPVSDSQAYKQAGNSICVGVLASIVSKLLHK